MFDSSKYCVQWKGGWASIVLVGMAGEPVNIVFMGGWVRKK